MLNISECVISFFLIWGLCSLLWLLQKLLDLFYQRSQIFFTLHIKLGKYIEVIIDC